MIARSQISKLGALAIVATSLWSTVALAGQVKLKSEDGVINLTGELLDFKDDHYVIRSPVGELRVSAKRVNCEGTACPNLNMSLTAAPISLQIRGSDTVGVGLMPLLLSGYASHLNAQADIQTSGKETDVIASMTGDGGFGEDMGRILVTSTTSGDSFKYLLEKSTDFGMASRRIKPAEARFLRDSGAGNMVSPKQEHILAIDSLVVIVNPQNPVRDISIAQVRDIYSGKITNWKDLDGDDQPIHVVNRQGSSGTRSVFEKNIYGDDEKTLGENQKIADDNNEMAAIVNDDPNAIGYVGYAFQRGAKALNLINECGMVTEADAFSAKVEEYALQRRLYLYNRAENITDEMTRFLNYALSENADGVIAKSGFIDLGIQRKSQDMNGPRARMLLDPSVDAFEGGVMREMLAKMVNYDRLSVTFRFRTGSSVLDERGRLDMERLSNFLAKQPENTKVVAVGFTDNVGPFASNRDLSLSRAQQVVEELKVVAGERLNDIDIVAEGYGEIAPSTCNGSERGRAVNRRVEMWIENANRG